MNSSQGKHAEHQRASDQVPDLASLDNQIIEAAPDAVVVVDTRGKIVLVNRQTETIFGYPRSELLGKDLQLLLPERFHAAHTRHQQRYFATPRTRPMGLHLDLFGRRKNGDEFPVEISLSPLTTAAGECAISIIRDVTEQRRLQDALRASEREAAARAQEAEARRTLLQLIIDELPSGVYLVRGTDARLVLANRAAHAVWGAAWPIGQPMHTFLTTGGTRILAVNGRPLGHDELATIRTVQTGQPVIQQQEVIRHPDGIALPVLVSAIAVDPHLLAESLATETAEVIADEPGAVVVLQDVTALQEAERLKDEFVGIAAHELRNPLAALKGYADMLMTQTARGKGPTLADWQEEAIASIDQAAERLTALTDDLLDVTRLQSGRLALHRTLCDLTALVQRVVQRAQVTTQSHTLIFAAEDPVVIHLDAMRIEQVVSNLVNNAVKYSPNGGDIAITLHADTEREVVIFSIRDQGIGIPLQQQAHLFNRFARADNAQDFGITGTGLGLYLCRELIERHSGRIWFESSEGQGSTFFFTLPLSADDAGGTSPGIGEP
jgi:PAS domain S-box-containing protein